MYNDAMPWEVQLEYWTAGYWWVESWDLAGMFLDVIFVFLEFGCSERSCGVDD